MADFVSLNEFVDRVDAAKVGQYADTMKAGLASLAAATGGDAQLESAVAGGGMVARAEAASRIASGDLEREFDLMKTFILNRYAKARSRHTFLDAGGNFVDCIGYEEQQAAMTAQAAGHKLLKGPPPAAKFDEKKPTAKRPLRPVSAARPPLDATVADPFGNAVAAPKGTVPVRRVTLSQFARVGRFERFFEKLPAAPLAAPAAASGPGPDGFVHRHAGAQAAPAPGGFFGCTTYLNLWGPNPAPGTMSLSQCWIVGGPTANGLPDTVESGWMVQPQLFGTNLPVLFVYFNPDGYGPRSGYGVNRFGEGFIAFRDAKYVVNAASGGFDVLSTPGGPQKGFYMQWQRDANGNWILYCGPEKTPQSLQGVGYFPAHLYATTALRASASVLQFGGEVAARSPAAGSGPMGSGVAPANPATGGFGTVAFQKEISVQTAVAQPMTSARLTAFETDFSGRGIPDPYRSIVGSSTNSSWGSFLFFGGLRGPL